MKEIIFVRHAKAVEGRGLDKERSLSKRGVSDAQKVAHALKQRQEALGVLFSSPALRALETAQIFAQTFAIPPAQIQLEEGLYNFVDDPILDVIYGLDASLDKVVLFGHNPAFTYLVHDLGDRSIDVLPTAAVVKLRFEVTSWSEVKRGHTELLIFPKDLE